MNRDAPVCIKGVIHEKNILFNQQMFVDRNLPTRPEWHVPAVKVRDKIWVFSLSQIFCPFRTFALQKICEKSYPHETAEDSGKWGEGIFVGLV